MWDWPDHRGADGWAGLVLHSEAPLRQVMNDNNTSDAFIDD